ncbi:unnamed protein product [Parnassius apollo]|uniref:(apollo) hypothetical protein n=1 Tax=Parnassius apollo TaxID=110799 RepID=A0A8S3W485_PARAO|nr:unnamed protein product [Parnassius apollo]
MPETSPRSLPDTTLLENSQIIDLKNEIDQLTLQLTSAHNEIMELNLENTNLRKTLEQYQKKESVYKKLLDILSKKPSSDLTVQEKNECYLESKEKTVTIKTKVKDKNQILIVGDQQALGMASALMKIRSSGGYGSSADGWSAVGAVPLAVACGRWAAEVEGSIEPAPELHAPLPARSVGGERS